MKIITSHGFFRNWYFYSNWLYDLRKFYYKVKGFLWNRYSVVKSRHLGYTWIDRDRLLLFTMFEILEQFVEKECSPGHVEWYGEYGHKVFVNGREKFVRDEMDDLLKWWNERFIPYDNYELPEQTAEHPEALTWFTEREDGLYEFKPIYESEEDRIKDEEHYGRITKLDNQMEKEKIEYMNRLVRISPSMWT